MRKHDLKRGVIIVFSILFISLFIIKLAYTFGISTPYLENDALKVKAGQSYEYPITIQNGDDQGYYVDINYSSTNDVAILRYTTYLVPSNTYNNTFFFDITIPKNASVGKTYFLEYSAKPRINESAPVVLGVEIKRSIKILVTDENGTSSISPIQKPLAEKEIKNNNSIKQEIIKYVLVIIIVILLTAIINRIWRLSKGMSSRLGNERVTNYTISQAINLAEVKTLLEKMSNEEFKLQEIKNIIKEKISELTEHNLIKDIKKMSRKDLIKAINNIDKTK